MSVPVGHLADATRVANMARLTFDRDVKTKVRSDAFAFISARCPGAKVIDLWGGGAGCQLGRDLGLEMIAVEDGSWLRRAFGVSRYRGQRALRILAEREGYAWRWGSVDRFCPEATGAFLDFCGHWSQGVRRALLASTHMNAIVITLMPERVAVGSLPIPEWDVIYRALIGATLPDHRVRYFRRYRRRGGQWAFVYFVESDLGRRMASGLSRPPTHYRTHEVSPRPRSLTPVKPKSPELLAKMREMQRIRLANPAYRAEKNLRRRLKREQARLGV